MKRPPGLWLLLSAGVLWLCFQDVSCVRATSLIFGKSTTTSMSTSTSTSTAAPDADAAGEEESVTEAGPESANGTKLSGNPQQDYIYDPNLPRELDGYNLTEYPFYERVPEEIDFKCDGLHDGFYASVVHKCQVYHHCLFGTRFDFLCANYTAFDQKTFICHFVSEVDCVNSKKFWHRNDALYQAASTTTIKPLIVYTPPAPPAILTGGARRPAAPPLTGRRPKPPRRRRPAYDYYDDYEEEADDYYEDPRYTATEAPRSEGRRRKRPRPRPRPVYDDEYEDYEDERYDRRRGGGGRRDEDRPYRRGRPGRRNKHDRRKYDDEYDEDIVDEDARFDRSEERKNKRPKDERRTDDRRTDDRRTDDRRADDRRTDDRKDKRPAFNKRRQEEEETVKDDRRYSDDKKDKRPSDERRSYRPSDDKRKQEDPVEDRRRPNDDDDGRRYRPRKGQRRPVDDDYDDEDVRPPSRKKESTTEEPKTMVKPSGGSVYDRPRVAPRIRPPVPKSEADKFSFKSTAKPTKAPIDEEYYDDYEDEPVRPKNGRPKGDSSAASNIDSRKSQRPRDEGRDKGKPLASRSREASLRKPDVDDDYEDEERPRRPAKPKNEERRVGPGSRKRPAVEEYDDYEDEIKSSTSTQSSRGSIKDRKYGREESKSKSAGTASTSTTTTTTTTEEPLPKEETTKPAFRVVKRPFLPSRGGNPYSPRGLQPVGLKSDSGAKPVEAKTEPPESDELLSSKSTESKEYEDSSSSQEKKQDEKQLFKPSPIVVKVPFRAKYPTQVSEEDYRPVSNRPITPVRYKSIKEYDSRTTQKPKPIEKNPLDINENEYDVTLNDALNPTLPNLPVRSFPTGFSVANDYTFSSFHRPRYVVDATINQASSEYSYRYKAPQRYDSYTNGRTDQDYSPASYTNVNAQNYQNFRPSPRVTHTQAQTYYNTY